MIAEKVLQHSNRGMDILYQYIPQDIYEQTAKALLETPSNRNILLFTGFITHGKQETDGPVGTYFLAKALYNLGYYPIVVTDFHCKDYFDQAEQNFETLVVPKRGFSQSFMYKKIIETYDPVAMISIETPGRSADGYYRNMKGELIDGENAPLDQFFLEDLGPILSIGIGDGGNEIGMGNYEKELENELDYKNACAVKVDYCLIGTTSNWSAYGLIALLSKGDLPNPEDLKSYYDYILSLGAVDGVTGKKEYSVDGNELSRSFELLFNLKN